MVVEEIVKVLMMMIITMHCSGVLATTKVEAYEEPHRAMG